MLPRNGPHQEDPNRTRPRLSQPEETSPPHPRGFTLIELMVTVAIVGLISSLALPNMMAQRLRAKRAEIPTSLDAIRTLEIAYHAEWDAYTATGPCPSAIPPNGALTDFEACPNAAKFDMIGFDADGRVRAQYEVLGVVDANNPMLDSFEAQSLADMDEDGNNAYWMATHEFKPMMISANDVY